MIRIYTKPIAGGYLGKEESIEDLCSWMTVHKQPTTILLLIRKLDQRQ